MDIISYTRASQTLAEERIQVKSSHPSIFFWHLRYSASTLKASSSSVVVVEPLVEGEGGEFLC
jgi:hypothetical protein